MNQPITLLETTREIVGALPCSISLPAGCGKTQLITAIAREIAQKERCLLILTHTHAGVDVLRKRLRSFGVADGAVMVQTIDSWCFNLFRHRPQLAEIEVLEIPDWSNSREYHQAAARAVQSAAVQSTMQASYAAVIVDEYQDCLIDQHSVVLALADAVPVAVFGDPLQGLFSFGTNQPVEWARDVIPHFHALEVPTYPWRWHSTNQELGEWLLGIRTDIQAGQNVVLDRSVVSWIESGDWAAKAACDRLMAKDGPMAALGQFRPDCVATAKRLSGNFGVMEEIEGKEMMRFARIVDGKVASEIAGATVDFAVSCASGVAAAFPRSARDRLRSGKAFNSTSPEKRAAVASVNLLLTDPCMANIRNALIAISAISGFSLYCQEAWEVIISALAIADRGKDGSVQEAVQRLRDNIRVTGRNHGLRVVSRPLLVKGLEYDHVALLNADAYNAAELYVALTRGRKSVIVVSRSTVITPRP